VYHLLGIDDSDTTTSSDTPELAQMLGFQLETRSLARLVNISCHQLYQHPSTLCTTHNIACCLLIDTETEKIREIDLFCRQFLLRESAPKSNPGYALAAWSQFDPEIVNWGKRAKLNLLNRMDAITLSRSCKISMAGISGSGAGVIGALAAIGLRYEGNDGWISWMQGITSVHGIYTQMQLSQFIHFDLIESDLQKHPALDDRIQISEPLRPYLKDGKTVLPITAAKRGSEFEWQTIAIAK
jgi:hypothetical protein